MATDARRHTVPTGAAPPRRQDLLDLSLSISDVVYVANSTARAQLVADLVAKGVGPAASRPLYVHRGDAPAGREIEYTTDGTTFRAVNPTKTATFTLSGPAPNATLIQLTPTLVGGANGWTTTPGANKIAVTDAGIYAFDALISLGGASATGRSLISLVHTATSVEIARYPIGLGEDAGSAAKPSIELPAGGQLAVNVLQTSGGTRTVTGTATLTRIG